MLKQWKISQLFLITLSAIIMISSQMSLADQSPKGVSFDEDFSEGIGSQCLIDLHNAITDNNHVKLRILLEKYKNTNEYCIDEIIPDNSGQTLIMYAVLTGKSKEIIMLLLEYGADVTIGENMGYTPIHGAAFQGRAELAKILVLNGKMNVNDRHDGDGYTPLHRATWGSEKRHADTVRVLLELGADADDPICTTDHIARGNVDVKDCYHLIETTRNPETVKVLKEFTKLEKYKMDQNEL